MGGAAWNRFSCPLTINGNYWGGANDGKFHGNLAEIAILAADPFIYPTSGALNFDDLALVPDSESFTLDLAQAKWLPAPAAAGRLRPRLGVAVHFDLDGFARNASLNVAQAAGFSFVRTDLLWQAVASDGGYHFSTYDKLLRALEARGMSALFILDYGHPEHSPLDGFPWTPLRAADIAAFSRFAEAAAAHFRGHNVRFEIWNEPNQPLFWQPNPDAFEYAALAQSALAAVRRGAPGVPVSLGGINADDFGYLAALSATGLQQGNTTALHPYLREAPEQAGNILSIAAGLANAGNKTQKISLADLWDTEWGYSASWGFADGSVPESKGHDPLNRMRQAIWAVRKALAVWVLNLPVSVWYDLRDDPPPDPALPPDPADPEQNFGLVDVDYHAKAAFFALRALKSVAQDGVYTGMLDNAPPGLHALKIKRRGKSTYVVWQERAAVTNKISWPQQPGVSVMDMLGEPVSPACAKGVCSVAAGESTGPVYLTFQPG